MEKRPVRTENARSYIGGKSATATSYWDRTLTVSEVALLLNMRISVLKKAVREQGTIKGHPAPRPSALDGDKMFFDGKDIEPLVAQLGQAK